MEKNLSKVCVLLLVCLFINSVVTAQTSQHNRQTNMTYQIINAANKTFGYDIYADGHIMIHQASVPALPGNEGFKTKVGAEKVAQLVITKIQKGECRQQLQLKK